MSAECLVKCSAFLFLQCGGIEVRSLLAEVSMHTSHVLAIVERFQVISHMVFAVLRLIFVSLVCVYFSIGVKGGIAMVFLVVFVLLRTKDLVCKLRVKHFLVTCS